MGWETLEEVRDGSVDAPKSPGQVGGRCQSFGTGWGTLPMVWDGSRAPS